MIFNATGRKLRFTARTVDFTDLARASAVFVRIHDTLRPRELADIELAFRNYSRDTGNGALGKVILERWDQ